MWRFFPVTPNSLAKIDREGNRLESGQMGGAVLIRQRLISDFSSRNKSPICRQPVRTISTGLFRIPMEKFSGTKKTHVSQIK
jgi:hypothetical protein